MPVGTVGIPRLFVPALYLSSGIDLYIALGNVNKSKTRCHGCEGD
jgi:hypothetical protein